MFFRQLYEKVTSTYTYLLADEDTKEAVLIDPVMELVDRDLELVDELGFTLKYGINTHVHADHVTGTGVLKEKLGPSFQSVLGDAGNGAAKADVKVKEGDFVEFGKFKVQFFNTPGHTSGCHTLVVEDGDVMHVFTGDTVLIRGCGRTDFQEGSPDTLYDSVHKKIFTLPDEAKIWPAHDYKGRTQSTVGEEKKFNPRLTKSKQEFKSIMENLNLAYPKFIDRALPWNLVCGIHELVPEEAKDL